MTYKKYLLPAGMTALLWVYAFHDGFGHGLFYPTRRAVFTVGLELLIVWLALVILMPTCWRWLGKLPRRDCRLYLSLALAMGIMMVTSLPFPNERVLVFPHDLQIQPLDDQGCQPVTLLGFETEQGYTSYEAFGELQGWERIDKHLVSLPEAGALNWHGYASDAKLFFRGSTTACPVRVTWDGKSLVYPLDSPDTLVIVHHDLPQPAVVPILSFAAVLSLMSGLALVFIFLLVWVETTFSPASKLPSAQDAGRSSGKAGGGWLWIAAPAAISLVIFELVTRHFGLSLSNDSASYVSAARSLAAGKGYLMANGDAMDWWPPLYSFLLSIGYRIPGLDPISYARWLNISCYSLTVLEISLLLRRLVPGLNRMVTAGLALLAGLSPALYTANYLLSESIFILMVTSWLVFLERYSRRAATSDLVLTAFFAGMSALARYIGGLVVMTASLGALLIFILRRLSDHRSQAAQPREHPLPPNFQAGKQIAAAFLPGAALGAAVGALASLPIFVWLYRNQIVSNSLTGTRFRTDVTVGENIHGVLSAVAKFFGVWSGGWASIGKVLSAMLLLGVLVWLIALARQELHRHGTLSRETSFASLMALLLIGYSAWLIISLTMVANAAINIRLISPLFPLLLLLLVYVGAQLADQNRRRRWLVWCAGGLLALGMGWAGVHTVHQTLQNKVQAESDGGSIYPLRHSAVLEFINQNPLPDQENVYSNCPRCLVIYADVYNATIFDQLPANRPYLPQPGQAFTLIWLDQVKPSDLAWQGAAYRQPLPDLTALLGRQVVVTPLFEGVDGGVYQVMDKKP
ncbi:MAG: hypothetical protein HPY76_06070 [Anaerolineae bacterium]|nr:hypothetical protein [Anaerolineae bacterium]